MKILFIVNPSSGSNDKDLKKIINDFFKDNSHENFFYEMKEDCTTEKITSEINKIAPDKVVAVGGDGTVKLAAEALISKNIPLGILPAGSANGLAKELGIPENETKALQLICNGKGHAIHLLKVNDEWCIHLSDIGFNAFVVKKFEVLDGRGMLGYLKASWQTLLKNPQLEVEINVNNKKVKHSAAMIVLANGTRYGTGVLINPEGKIDDDLFEVIIIKKISFSEIFKMVFTHKPFNPKKTELLQTKSIHIQSKHAAHFQVDGEYMEKVNDVKAEIHPGALKVIY